MTDEKLVDEMNKVKEYVSKLISDYDQWKSYNPDLVMHKSDPLGVYNREVNFRKYSDQLSTLRFICGEVDGVGSTFKI